VSLVEPLGAEARFAHRERHSRRSGEAIECGSEERHRIFVAPAREQPGTDEG
jgi:hypothetical protein